MADHAKLSASGSKRWLSCPPSVKLESNFPDTTNEYAEEGTHAHAVAEIMLQKELKMMSTRAANKVLKGFEENQYHSKELTDYIKGYVDYIIEIANGLPKDAEILLEQRLDFSQWVPEGFGTGDVVMVYNDTVEVIDLKYGKGVPVSAEDNSQMRLYALGAYTMFSDLYDITKVKMTIAQPRLDSISTDELTLENLLDWAENEVSPKATMAMDGEGEYCAGEHCKFCKAKAICKARAEKNLELAKYDFADPDLLTLDEVGEILQKAKDLTAWANDIRGYALSQALSGETITGWKLIEGKSNRVYKDEDEVIKYLKAEEFSEDRYINRKIKGITDLVKTIGKQSFDKMVENGLIIKPKGTPTLVPESDKRPAMDPNTAAADVFDILD